MRKSSSREKKLDFQCTPRDLNPEPTDKESTLPFRSVYRINISQCVGHLIHFKQCGLKTRVFEAGLAINF